jgi:predicted component of type VI protein secretion system
VQARLNAARTELAFLVLRDELRRQRIVTLEPHRQVSLGRSPTADVELSWDSKVSRIHAVLECIGGAWMVSDDGLSSNGTFCNHERVHGRRRLSDGDSLSLGNTVVVFHDRTLVDQPGTDKAPTRQPPALSPTQQRVLVALCRPYRDATPFSLPATNHEIASELYLGVDAVKAHLRVLFEKFGITELAQNQKRGRLAELAFESGAISVRDLD